MAVGDALYRFFDRQPPRDPRPVSVGYVSYFDVPTLNKLAHQFDNILTRVFIWRKFLSMFEKLTRLRPIIRYCIQQKILGCGIYIHG